MSSLLCRHMLLWILCVVSSRSHSPTSEDTYNQSWTCRCHGSGLQRRYSRVSDGWGAYVLVRALLEWISKYKVWAYAITDSAAILEYLTAEVYMVCSVILTPRLWFQDSSSSWGWNLLGLVSMSWWYARPSRDELILSQTKCPLSNLS